MIIQDGGVRMHRKGIYTFEVTDVRTSMTRVSDAECEATVYSDGKMEFSLR
ncbi:MAG: hypothetical protein H6558_00645 [Lewinellaceae bacterium]|nr:hypothetical protein [Lewinellaceae bacterium]